MISEDEILNARLLIVDDEPNNVFLLEQGLSKGGFKNLRSTTDPREALEIYPEFKPHLVLLDLKMPHMDGFQVMEKIKEIEENGYVSVLVLTAFIDRATRLKSLQHGARDFLTKPIDLMETICRVRNLVEVRLLNESLESKVRERTEELNATRIEIIRKLGRAAEYRDNETGMHVVRMSHFSASLAKHMGFDEAHCELILNASPMHDIGKIGIPDGILLHPGKLESEKWEKMKTHTEIGGLILDGSQHELLQLAQKIALSHHEKWDGSGYPEGLKGEDIPIEVRIISICDVFDALTSERPYKKAWPVEEALDFIKGQRELHFDPEVVDRFLEVMPEILEIKDKFRD
ncbi:MAG: response regulator [Candidatus Nitrohelix vancouverensis]|uniref:Response regulator n=1 Tax=Candidatus Nitrohelix vancouverensis TaxID=2705534 RepID=A0A7T0C1H9_9BACT|nr:MAG: response regulator [Candidatus Nitrohelix vancouverensis]